MTEIWGIPIRWYGMILALAVMVGAKLSEVILKKEGDDGQMLWDGLVWVVGLGIVGARVYHVVDEWEYYAGQRDLMIAVWNGGLGIYGALGGGALGLVGFLWVKRKSLKRGVGAAMRRYLDAAAFGIPIGQAIGRWGNYVNQELYGRPTSMPWGIYIAPERRLAGYEGFERFQPLFLYESVLSLGVLAVVCWLYRFRVIKFGESKYFGVYLIGYGLVRLILEPMRMVRWQVGDVPTASLVSVVGIGVGLLLLVRNNGYRRRKTS